LVVHRTDPLIVDHRKRVGAKNGSKAKTGSSPSFGQRRISMPRISPKDPENDRGPLHGVPCHKGPSVPICKRVDADLLSCATLLRAFDRGGPRFGNMFLFIELAERCVRERLSPVRREGPEWQAIWNQVTRSSKGHPTRLSTGVRRLPWCSKASLRQGEPINMPSRDRLSG
jgi:hypothetical protein